MRPELSRKARIDVADIRDFSVAQFGAAKAASYLEMIEQAFRRIIEYPAMGAVDPILAGDMRSLSCGQHRIFYALGEQAILIVRVLHKSMEAGRHLPN